MKRLIIFSISFIFFFGCQSKSNRTEYTEVTVDEILTSPESYVDKTIHISGTVSHVCRHGGQKMFIFGENPDNTIRISVGSSMPEFDVALEGSEVEIDGIMKELRIDEAYVAELEKESGIEADSGSHTETSEVSKIHQKEQEMSNIEILRKQIAESGKGYISDFWVENIKLTVKPEESVK